MKQTATLEIEIPNGHKLSIFDIHKQLKKIGIKCKITACLNHLKIPKNLLKPR